MGTSIEARERLRNERIKYLIEFVLSDDLFVQARVPRTAIRSMQKVADARNLPVEVVDHWKTWYIKERNLTYDEHKHLQLHGWIPKGKFIPLHMLKDSNNIYWP